jgi:hypothetical protein
MSFWGSCVILSEVEGRADLNTNLILYDKKPRMRAGFWNRTKLNHSLITFMFWAGPFFGLITKV